MKYFYFLFLIIISFCANAQVDSIQINTDRPGFSEYPKTIPKGYFQIEAGFSYESETVNPSDRLQLINWNNTLIKFGLIEGVELRLSQSYQSERLLESGTSPQFIWQSFSGPVVVGTKINLLKEKGLTPQTAIVAEYGFNTLSPEAFQRNDFYRIQLSSKYLLNPEWYIMGNLGFDNSYNSPVRLRYTLNSGYSLNEKLSVYAEIYGFRSQANTPLNYFDGGFIYLINPRFQLDVHAGFDLIQQTNNLVEYQQSFLAFGLGYLFKVEK
jgi:hypothetical protein